MTLLLLLLLGMDAPPGGPNETEFAHRMKAEDASERGAYGQCAEWYRLAREADKTPSRQRKNAHEQAVCWAVFGRYPAALEALKDAADLGWRWSPDSKFRPLHGMPGWAQIAATIDRNRSAHLRKVNKQLYQIYLDDQAARTPGIKKRGSLQQRLAEDDERRVVVRRLLAQGKAKHVDDFYNAALSLIHGRNPEEHRIAHDLAVRAVALEPDNDRARWLAAAAKDRELVTLGKPQLFGTQYKFSRKDGRVEPLPVNPAVTDEQRRGWNVPPLARMYLMAARNNRYIREAAELAAKNAAQK